MTEPITLTCPNCGGKLIVTADIDRFACSYCGNEHIIKRGEGTISLQPLVTGLKKVQYGVANVQQGVDKTASELAIRRLQEELSLLRNKRTIKDSVWQGDRARLGCIVFFVSAFPAFLFFLLARITDLLPFPGSSIIAILTYLLPLVVLGFVFYFINMDKKEKAKQQAQLDVLISTKEEELTYHQDLVSRR